MGLPIVRALRAELDAVGFALAVVALVALTLVVLAVLRRRGARGSAALLALLGTWSTLAGVAALTLLGTEGLGAEQRLTLDPIEGAWGWYGIAWRPVIDNVTLFVPLGAMLAAWWRRLPLALVWLVAVGVSVGVEAFQLLVPTGRIASTTDVLSNGLGAAIGVALAGLTGVRSAAAPVRADA